MLKLLAKKRTTGVMVLRGVFTDNAVRQVPNTVAGPWGLLFPFRSLIISPCTRVLPVGCCGDSADSQYRYHIPDGYQTRILCPITWLPPIPYITKSRGLLFGAPIGETCTFHTRFLDLLSRFSRYNQFFITFRVGTLAPFGLPSRARALQHSNTFSSSTLSSLLFLLPLREGTAA